MGPSPRLLHLAPETFGSPNRDTAGYPTIGYATTWVKSSLTGVQRLFSMFPPGWPGIGLLLLRSSVAIALLAEAYLHRQELPGWVHGAAVLLAVSLITGYLTPIAAAIALLFHVLVWSRLGVGGAALAVVVSLEIIALALLGPGEYSVDAYRFGRRVVVLPPR